MLLALAVAASLLAPSPTSAAVRQSLTLSIPTAVETAIGVRFTGVATPVAPGRPVVLMRWYLSGTTWKPLRAGRSSPENAEGAFAAATSFSAAGTYRVRAVAAAYQGLPAVASPTVTVSAHLAYARPTPSPAIADGEITKVRGTLPGITAPRQIWVQRRRAGSAVWTTVAKVSSNRYGSFVGATRAPRAGSYALRAYAPSVIASGRRRPTIVSPATRWPVVTQTGALSVSPTMVAGTAVAARSTFAPARFPRPVALQELRAGSWVTLVSRGQSPTGGAAPGSSILRWTAPAAPGRVTYRALTLARDGAPAFATPPRVVAVVAAPTGVRYRQISAGDGHTCAVTTGGAVKCWGTNSYGQLGDGSTNESSTPSDVVGLGSGVVSVSTGAATTCAVTTGAAASCWGEGLGVVPVTMAGLGSGVASLSVGAHHTCAVTIGGAVKCWGSNGNGELGNGSKVASPTPVDVVGQGSGVASVSAGYSHTCAVTTGGAVKCWGWNLNGQLGDGGTTGSRVPVDVVGLSSGVASVSAGTGYTCALSSVGGVTCWGLNGLGQLGNGTTSSSSTPVDVVGLGRGVAALSTGYTHACAVTTGAGATCWGPNNDGQLGIGELPGSYPTPVGALLFGTDVASVSAGFSHTCALTTGGAARCVGLNFWLQLGIGSRAFRSWTPVDVIGSP